MTRHRYVCAGGANPGQTLCCFYLKAGLSKGVAFMVATDKVWEESWAEFEHPLVTAYEDFIFQYPSEGWCWVKVKEYELNLVKRAIAIVLECEPEDVDILIDKPRGPVWV